MIQSLLYFETVEEDPYFETIVKLSLNERPAIEFIVKSNSQISLKLCNISSTELLSHVFDFYLPYVKYLLFKIRDLKSHGFEDHKFISASLLLGMWQSIRASPDFEQFSDIIENFEARFQSNRQNLYHLLKRETIEMLIPNLFIDV